jgi:hypothetical protein
MATLTIPDGHIAVCVFVPRAEGAEPKLEIVGLTDEDSEHGCIADAQCVLAVAACEVSDDLVDEVAALEADDEPDDDEEEEEETEPEAKPS